MNKMKLNIWGREFELNVGYQNYPGEVITELQEKTLSTIGSIDFTEARIGVEKYITQHFATELGEDDLSNIFRFVMPKSILIMRSDDSRLFAIMCNYKLDMEHGIAIAYKNEAFVAAGPQDLVL